MTTKYFMDVFGVNGDRADVPNPTQLDGTVSYEDGFPVGYQLDYSDPASLNIPRDQFNQILYDVTLAIQQVQQNGFPEFITSAMNGGAPYAYVVNACVYQPSDGNNYVSLINANTDTPPSVNWRLITFASQIPAGSGTEYWGVSLPSGWLWQNGLTIGNASSNGTARANADTADLFTVLWALPSTTFQLYSSVGAPVSRGVSAAADYAANRAIALPDTRERVVAGAGTMGGTADPLRITTGGAGFSGVVVGATGGLETVQLTANQNGTHSHAAGSIATASSGIHQHAAGTLAATNSGGHQHNVELYNTAISGSQIRASGASVQATNPITTEANSGAHSHTILGTTANAGAHTHTMTGSTDSSGLGSAHQNTQPTIICNKIIKL